LCKNPTRRLPESTFEKSSVFISHTHADKPFVRRIGADLAALGARVWIDDAELNIGDSLMGRISVAIDEMQFLAVVLSPDAVASTWVQQELEQAMSSQLAEKNVKILPLLYRACQIPGFLQGNYMQTSRKHTSMTNPWHGLLARLDWMRNPVGPVLCTTHTRASSAVKRSHMLDR
jgi:hypothetical protein